MKKVVLGQFFTEKNYWLQPQVEEFIKNSSCSVAFDPFAGSGCLLQLLEEHFEQINSCIGYDIDTSLGWKFNDSLLEIPSIPKAILVTNPPYISNYSAARKKVGEKLKKYFDKTQYDDVYLLALDNMLAAQKYIVAIIPETFINSTYKQKSKLASITILEMNCTPKSGQKNAFFRNLF